jgi:hypothetical protein
MEVIAVFISFPRLFTRNRFPIGWSSRHLPPTILSLGLAILVGCESGSFYAPDGFMDMPAEQFDSAADSNDQPYRDIGLVPDASIDIPITTADGPIDTFISKDHSIDQLGLLADATADRFVSTDHSIDQQIFLTDITVDSPLPSLDATVDNKLAQVDAYADLTLDAPPIPPDSTLDSFQQPDSFFPENAGSLYFDGVDDFVLVPQNSILSAFSAVSIEVWVKPEDKGMRRAIVSKRISTTRQQYLIRRNSLGSAEGGIGNASYGCIAYGGGSLFTVNHWTHIVLTWKSSRGTPRLYINGNLISTSFCVGGMTLSIRDLLIGTVDENGTRKNFFQGWLDELRIWNNELGKVEIQSRMLQTLSGNEKGLVGYWRFDDAMGDTLTDSSTYGNNGRLGAQAGTDNSDPTWSTDLPF